MRPIHARTAILAAAVSCTAVIAATAPVAAQETTAPREATIIVSGEGSAKLAPDMASLTLSVVKQAKTAEAALAANNAALTQVLADLKAAGIAERDLQTNGFSIQPLYRPQPAGGPATAPEITGYEVNNGLAVRVRDLARLGDVIDRSVKLGINRGGQVTFSNDNPDAAVDQARKAAVAEAIAKAKTLTEAAGVRLGRVIEISENFSRPMPQPMYRAAPMSKDMAESTPIASGENSYSVTVNVTYGLEQ
jgi:uncharacterized protein YggE